MKYPLILGDGLLATELNSQSNIPFISRKKDGFDVVRDKELIYLQQNIDRFGHDVIINCIAFTDTYSDDKDLNWQLNVEYVKSLIDFCNRNKIKLVHISTDYVYTHSDSNASEDDVPVHCKTWYGYTKLIGDALVQLESNDYLLIRTSFKPKPFPYPKAFTEIKGNFDSVDVISSEILKLINSGASGLYNVGTDVKSPYDLALRDNPDIGVLNNIHPLMPKDVTMDVSKYKKEVN